MTLKQVVVVDFANREEQHTIFVEEFPRREDIGNFTTKYGKSKRFSVVGVEHFFDTDWLGKSTHIVKIKVVYLPAEWATIALNSAHEGNSNPD